ncbi:metal ABC transporter substrate-binding protein [Tuwongella immobilis]|uniref:Adhesion lipoprotein n=1 Tax=Tuwongella immobilis TaxID=692036 RepID=A0A6C2YNN4_9BACT|nr:metal ABC transporter substrate-binding protein [Tuwongella immobilis]VIP03046.1 periplasmic solute binding protein : Uncharacterized protein OS=Candidatus Entotheonella sp. TSY1 GN=ETSY1_10415 PE=4 SV=1: TroA [Tuwongella immobilis]VTS03225.1 periplasmic solute binding protein : Uncharacterized protein OS=Candidatus Entotheonella sp. TSY1 GN=ETSY1_10415 PE=4 SV=1: TroA [Tuwongella immobilis]
MWRSLAMMWLVGCAVGCGTSAPPTNKPGKPQVYVVNDPLRSFATTIGGQWVDVHFPIPADEDPDFWKPDAATLSAYQSADLILLNGATYGKWLTHAPLPQAVQVDTSSAFASKFIAIEGSVTHSHGAAGEHSHSGTASLTWLDLRQAKQQAEAVGIALTGILPETAHPEIHERTQKLVATLNELDAQMETLVTGNRAVKCVGSHPVFQYWARRYGVTLPTVHWEASDVPNKDAIAELEAILKTHPATWMIWESDPNPEAVQLLEKRGIRSVTFHTLGDKSDGPSFVERMQANLKALQPVFAR